MTNGKTSVSLDELLQGVARDRDRGTQTGSSMEPVPSPAQRGKRRRGPDAGPRLTADRLHERAVATLYGLRGLSRGEQARVLDRARVLLER